MKEIVTTSETDDAVTQLTTLSNSLPYTAYHVTVALPRSNYTTLWFIIDSGASPHISNSKSSFVTLFPWHNRSNSDVILADGKSSLPIEGIGTVRLQLQTGVTV